MKKKILIASFVALSLSSCKVLWNLGYIQFTNDVETLLQERAGVKVNPRCSAITRTRSGTCIFQGSSQLVDRLVNSFELSQPRNPIPIEKEIYPVMTKEHCEWMAEFNHQTPTRVYEYRQSEVITPNPNSHYPGFSRFSLYHRTDTNKICLQLTYVNGVF